MRPQVRDDDVTRALDAGLSRAASRRASGAHDIGGGGGGGGDGGVGVDAAADEDEDEDAAASASPFSLHEAVRACDLRHLTLLLRAPPSARIDVLAIDEDGFTALHEAACSV